VFPLENDVMKLDMLPPGQAATNSIPRAIIGEIQFPSDMARRKVSAGSNII